MHELQPGRYPIRLTTIQGHDVPEGDRPYYAVVRVSSILRETYRVNRLFTASSSKTEHPDTESSVVFRPYAYELDDADRLAQSYVSIGRFE